MDSGGSTDMTLAFELKALKALADPNDVFNNARQWTEYVGVVSEKPTYVVTNFTVSTACAKISSRGRAASRRA